MKFATVNTGNTQLYGAVSEAGFTALSPSFPEWATMRDVVNAAGLPSLAKAAEGRTVTHPNDSFTYAIPVPNPEKIICVGVNFPDRNAEYKDGQDAPQNMSLFPRFARSFTGHDEALVRPPETPQLDYEGEIAIIIGKGGRRILQADAYDHIAALSLCNEGTLRDWVRHAKFNVTQGKNWDGSGAIGPWLVPFDSRDQLEDVRLVTRVNGKVRQDDRTTSMMFPIPMLISYISTFTTLVPGDVILTGTPTGAGARFDPPIWLKPGDEVTVEVDGIGSLRNPVEDEA